VGRPAEDFWHTIQTRAALGKKRHLERWGAFAVQTGAAVDAGGHYADEEDPVETDVAGI
jgi:hypothetical protein